MHDLRTSGTADAPITVYGAGGHTGRFIVAELRRRQLPVVAVGRNLTQLPPELPCRAAVVDDQTSLRHAFAGSSVVINAAGPFLDTAAAVIEAALAVGAGYIDVTAEQASAAATLADFDDAARKAGQVVIPAAGFYGGLADLLASALVGTRPLHRITTATALDRWWPTVGTRRTGERNRVPRWRVENEERVLIETPAQASQWDFGTEYGCQPTIELPFSETATLAHHHCAANIRSWFGSAALADLRDPSTPPPSAVDAGRRSAQRFWMEVVVEDGDGERRARARGHDIYAVSAPMVVEAASRLRARRHNGAGAKSLGAAFVARDFLSALHPLHLLVDIDPHARLRPHALHPEPETTT